MGSVGNSAIRGAAQGLTFGFSDELGGAEQAGLAALARRFPKLFGINPKYADEVSADYKTARDDNRAEDKAAEADNPKTYFASELVGGMLPGAGANVAKGLKLGESAAKVAARRYATQTAENAAERVLETQVKKAALDRMMKTAAAQGAVSGYGHGEHDAMSQGSVGDTLEGALSGMGGAAIGVLGGQVNGALRKAAPSVSPVMKKIANPKKAIADAIERYGAYSPLDRDIAAKAAKIEDHMRGLAVEVPGAAGSPVNPAGIGMAADSTPTDLRPTSNGAFELTPGEQEGIGHNWSNIRAMLTGSDTKKIRK